jgi:signal transduction histidine kinase/CheY-like chemotaxis protein
MRKSLIFSILITVLLVAVDGFLFKNINNVQVTNQKNFLFKQVKISSNAIVTDIHQFESDLNFILFSDDISELFEDNFKNSASLRKLELFYSSYSSLIKNIDIYDNNKNALNLFKDKKGNYISGKYLAQRQKKLTLQEHIKIKDSEYQYYIPVIKNNLVYANIVVSIDLSNYILSELNKYYIPDLCFQWVIDPESGNFLTNYPSANIRMENFDLVLKNLKNEIGEMRVQKIKNDSSLFEVTTVYSPVSLLEHKFGIAFSFKNDYFIKSVTLKLSLIFIISFILFLILISFLLMQQKHDRKLIDSSNHESLRLTQILENLPIGILIFDDRSEIILINQVARDMLQVKDNEQNTGNTITQKFFQASRIIKKKGKSSAYDSNHFVLYQKEGNEVVLYKREFPYFIDGNEIVISAFIDITPLEKARKYEAASNTAKSEFLAKMSHEIRTPMNGIIGMTDALNKGNLSKEQTEYIDIVKRSADMLLNIIDDILDYSKIEAGKMQLEEIPYRLSEEVKLSMDLFKAIIDDKGLKLNIEIEKNVPDDVIGDPFRLRQVLSNLISNAVKFTHEGEIKVSVKVEEQYNGNVTLLFEVADTGVGVPKERLESIFNSFTQAENSTSRKYGGSGLGTTIAKQLVTLMNGEIWVESPSDISKNKKYPGSKFSFTIEVFSNSDLVKEIDASTIKSFSDINTFIITQNINTKKRLMGYLNHLGLKVDVSIIGDEILSSIKKQLLKDTNPYKLVIIMDEPNFDGLWIARQLNQADLADKYRFIIISSNHKQENYIQTKLLKIDFYLTQPFEQDILKNYLYRCFPLISVEQPTKDIKLQKDISILVAEDNLINQKVAESIFNSIGYKIDIAIDGKEVVDMIKKKPYDIVFMDLQMPEKDGVDATVEIRGLGYQMPIVAMTATASKIGKDSALTSGMNDYITKPVKTEAVRKVLEKWFA